MTSGLATAYAWGVRLCLALPPSGIQDQQRKKQTGVRKQGELGTERRGRNHNPETGGHTRKAGRKPGLLFGTPGMCCSATSCVAEGHDDPKAI